MPPAICPNCGEPVPSRATTCPGCGADYETGWSEEAWRGTTDLPDQEFDYDEFVEREFGGKAAGIPRGLHWFWWLVGVLLLVALAIFWIF